jgi:SAM-dependent methyltransferase
MNIGSDLERKIIEEYQRVLDYCQTHVVPPYMLEISRQWSEERRWEMYWHLLHALPYEYDKKVVVDYGCKYGHLLPMFLSLGAKEVIGIDVEKEYVGPGSALFQEIHPNVRIIQSENGYVPIQPEMVDFVLLNEVISHVNPAFLEVVYAEISRILKPGGKVLISDGNNIGYKPCLDALFPLWDAWENGPDGVKTDRDTVIKSYLTRRKEIVRSHYPELDAEQVDYLARNTSSLWGTFLIKTIDDYVNSGELIRRPYRQGTSPTNPGYSGVVMERGFYSAQVIYSLESYGLEAQDLSLTSPVANKGQTVNTISALFKEIFQLVKNYVQRKEVAPIAAYPQNSYEPLSANLTIVGTKRTSD